MTAARSPDNTLPLSRERIFLFVFPKIFFKKADCVKGIIFRVKSNLNRQIRLTSFKKQIII